MSKISHYFLSFSVSLQIIPFNSVFGRVLEVLQLLLVEKYTSGTILVLKNPMTKPNSRSNSMTMLLNKDEYDNNILMLHVMLTGSSNNMLCCSASKCEGSNRKVLC